MGRKRIWFGTPAEVQAQMVQHKFIRKLCIICGKPNERYPLRMCAPCKDKQSEAGKRYRLTLKIKVFEAYGGVKCCCPNCNITEIRFLTLDHMEGNSWKRYPYRAGDKLYAWLIKHNYPSGFQVLCFNCNIARYVNKGMCPHLEN